MCFDGAVKGDGAFFRCYERDAKVPYRGCERAAKVLQWCP